MARFLLITSFILFSFSFVSTKEAALMPSFNSINWLTWEELEDASKKAPKKVIIDLYTDRCHFCKKMDQETYADTGIIQYINKHYYAVRFNAETKNSIKFKDKSYAFKRGAVRGYHQLAAEFTGGRLGYPTTIILDENLNVIQSIAGYQELAYFEQIIYYFGGNFHQKMPWTNFQANYKFIKDE